MVEGDELARNLRVIAEQRAELRQLIEADTTDRVVDQIEVAGVDAVDGEDADLSAIAGAEVGEAPALPSLLQPREDYGEILRLGAGATEAEAGEA